ncbi:L-2-amino-thiazoline-4-carboxylic acid hydrolase [Methylomagnum sp.]
MSHVSENTNHTPPAAPDEPSLTHLQRREIQAPVAACLIRGFAQALGREKALEIASAAIQEDARTAGRSLAAQLGGDSLAELRRIVETVWAGDEAVTLRFLEDGGSRLAFDVTRCRYAELYEAMGMKDLGFCLSCCRDGAFAEGFNPRIKLARTQTIMDGAAFCDFRFTLEAEQT